MKLSRGNFVLKSVFNILGLVWKIYSGSKKSTKQRAAIFVIERKSFDQRLQVKINLIRTLIYAKKAFFHMIKFG